MPKSTPQPGSTSADYLDMVAIYGGCVCNDISCYGDIDDCGAEDGCLLCHHLDPEWPCPAEEDADYPEAMQGV